ncbi:MAG: sulfatase-like hydrolase/transferase, partial [Rhodospirillaceae bacterium]|nr:sulfatase-like hydrolase/transferase [Rhodospirillaceae bacterium]
MTNRPNFLFFITDQQRADWLGCYGHPILKTPHIDAIAGQGTVFDNFYVASPVCMPNRASLLTGRYPTVHGLRYNGCVLPTSAVTFVDLLAAAGYHTASIGKS